MGDTLAKMSLGIEVHHGGVTQRKLSRTNRISPATVERWYKYHNDQKRSESANHTCPRVMGIDEHFFTRKKGYATTFVDLAKHKVFDVKLGRSESSLHSYLSALQDRDKVQVMVMDLSTTYRSIAQKYFPNATIVADRFHTHSGHRCGSTDQSSFFERVETAR